MLLENRRWILALLAIALVCILWGRPFYWALNAGDPDSRDFAPVIAGAHCLFSRCNPYDSNVVEQYFQQLTGRGVFIVPEIPVYPPSTFLTVSPLLPLAWSRMHLAWTLLGGLSLLAVAIFIVLKFRLYESLPALLPLFMLLQSGVIFPALWVGQPAVLVVSAGSAGTMLLASGTLPLLATILLALSLALKPQLLLGPALYLVWRRPTRKHAVLALVLAGTVFVIGTVLLRSQLGSLSFFAREAANARLSLEPGHTSDPSPANHDSPGFLNLQVSLYRLIPRVRIDNALTYFAILALVAVLAFAYWRIPAIRERTYVILGLIAFLGLLVTYHRFYDELLLLMIIPAAKDLNQRSRLLAWSLAGLIFLWIFGHRLMTALSPRMAKFPYSPIVGLAICIFLLFTLVADRTPAGSGEKTA